MTHIQRTKRRDNHPPRKLEVEYDIVADMALQVLQVVEIFVRYRTPP